MAVWLLLATVASGGANGVSYETIRDARAPWVAHVVRVPRQGFSLEAVHALGRSVGLAPVSAQLRQASNAVAAINGDFYERSGSYAGDPRGLQILQGEMISAPNGSASLWIDAAGEPHVAETQGLVHITCAGWRRGVALNAYREKDGVALYTPKFGRSTKTQDGIEIILKHPQPLRPGKLSSAQITEIRRSGGSPLAPETLVLSFGPAVNPPPVFKVGTEVVISTMTAPQLRGAATAISGGPVLVREGKRQRIAASGRDSYDSSTMMERHPRSAVGWNKQFYILVAVDGRQRGVSMGMSLDDLAAFMVRLGCDEAMNLDGGGSSTLWYDGKTRNHLADRYEREIANAIVVVERPAK